ncbi:NAD(P)/FAD-dependent oxidoreductase [Pseudonocardia yuanmonensis]
MVDTDVVIVGAGFAGLYQLHRVRGLGLRARVFEAGSGVGGTWYWNRYPGARCDVESLEYSYSFSPELEQEWEWTERYPGQPEILRYAEHVADRFDLRRDITFDTRVTHATWCDDHWEIRTDGGEELTATYCVFATGCLSMPKEPDLPGVGTFAGPTYSTSRWPHEGVDFTGRRVVVIGTGSSAVQSIPVIATQAAQLTVYQRTANYVVPARNAPMDPAAQAARKADYPRFRKEARESLGGLLGTPSEVSALSVTPEERTAAFDKAWATGGLGSFRQTFGDLALTLEANDTVADYIRGRIREIVADPETADALGPKDHPFGTKRPCLDTGYFETYNLPHVRLVDLRKTPIVAIEPAGVRTTEELVEVDDLVLATGFDAMTGALLAVDIRGRDGVRLRDAWADGPRTYLGLGVAGFPNLFTVTGPGSPSVLSNMLVSIEQHVDWITDCLAALAGRTIEAEEQAQEQWTAHVAEVGAQTLMHRADSWYLGANVPGKPRVLLPYVGGVGTYRTICDGVAARGYEGFRLTETA